MVDILKMDGRTIKNVPGLKGVISGPASPAMAGPIIRPVRAIFQWLLEVIKSITIFMIINIIA